MKLIFLEGGPASGKDVLGKKLVDCFRIQGEKSTLLDHDTYVEELRPTWVWLNEKSKAKDLKKVKIKYMKDINKYLANDFVVLAIGGTWLTDNDVKEYTSKLKMKTPVYLFHLNIPLNIRKQRLKQRGPAPLINLDKDQQQRDMITSWPGHIYQDINTPEIDAMNLMRLINQGIGLIFT
jgi:shikimate kinase